MASKKECKKWWWQDPKYGWVRVESGIFTIESQGKTVGTSPHSYGIIVKSEPRSETYFDAGEDGIVVASGGKKRIFNHIFDVGEHQICVLGRTNPEGTEKRWQEVIINITVNPRTDDREDPIVNFYQSKSSGQVAQNATGLDVAFSISLREKPKRIQWTYSKDYEKYYPKDDESGPKAARLISVSKVYKHVGRHEGFVKVWNNKDKEFTREFVINITDLG